MSVATQKGWQSDQRGWLPALCITAAVHAGILLQVDGTLLASRDPDTAPLLMISLVSAPVPAKPVKAVSPPPPPVEEQPEPLVTQPEERAQPTPVRQRPAPRPVQVQPPADLPRPQERLIAVNDLISPAAGPVADVPIEPPHTNAAYLSNPPPDYPRMLLRRGIEGSVLIRARVQHDGRCSEVQLKESSGFDLFDRAALSAVKDWRFVPARKGIKTVVAWVDVPIDFRIKTTR